MRRFPACLIALPLFFGHAGAQPGVQAVFRGASDGTRLDVRADGFGADWEGGVVDVRLLFRGRDVRGSARRVAVRGGAVSTEIGPYGSGASLPAGRYQVVVLAAAGAPQPVGSRLGGTLVALGTPDDIRQEDARALARLRERHAAIVAAHETMTSLAAIPADADAAERVRRQSAWPATAARALQSVWDVSRAIESEWEGCAAVPLTRSNAFTRDAGSLVRWIARDVAAPHGWEVPDPDPSGLNPGYAPLTPPQRAARYREQIERSGRAIADGVPEMDLLTGSVASLADLLCELAPLLEPPPPPPPPGEPPPPWAPVPAAWREAWGVRAREAGSVLEPLLRSEELIDQDSHRVLCLAQEIPQARALGDEILAFHWPDGRAPTDDELGTAASLRERLQAALAQLRAPGAR